MHKLLAVNKNNIRFDIIPALMLVFILIFSYIHPVYAMNNGMVTPVSAFGEEADQEELEHLLFAKLVYDYLDGYEGRHVSEYINDNPDLYAGGIWKDSDITYESLYNLVIGDWEIYKIQNNNTTTGFYGVAFKKDNRVVLAFRGSEMFTEEFALDESNDWTGTDFKFAIMNKLSSQFSDADHFYKMVSYQLVIEGVTQDEVHITLTGHSLGGALVAYESIMSDCYGYSFDGACGHVIDLVYFYGYLEIDGFTGVNDLDNVKFCNYTDDTGYVVADLIQHTRSESMYQIDRETNLDRLSENTLIPQLADAGSHIIWSYVGHANGNVFLNDKVNSNEYGYTYMPTEPVYLDITKNIIQAGMENINFDTPWNIFDYSDIDYEYLLGSATGIIKDGRAVLATKEGGNLNSYQDIGVSSAFDIDTVMYGGEGEDCLYGYIGNDVLIGGASTNILDGNLGNDTYIIDYNPGTNNFIDDIGGEKTTIILRGINIDNVKRIKFYDGESLDLGENQLLTIDVATPAKNVEFYTYNNGKLKQIGTLAEIDEKQVNNMYKSNYFSQFKGKDMQVAIFEGECTFDIYDESGKLVKSVTNTNVEGFSYEKLDVGMAYIDGTKGHESVFVIVKEGCTVKLNSQYKGNLAIAMVDSEGSFVGCDRKYERNFNDYQLRFDKLSTIGSQQGEVDLGDAIYSGVNLFFEFLSK